MFGGSLKLSWTFDVDGSRLDDRTKNTLDFEAECHAMCEPRRGRRQGEIHSNVDGVSYAGQWRADYERP